MLLKASATPCHQGHPPRVFPASWEAKLWGPSRNAKSCPTAQYCLCWEHSFSSLYSISMDFVLPGSCLCHVRNSVRDAVVCAVLSLIAQ